MKLTKRSIKATTKTTTKSRSSAASMKDLEAASKELVGNRKVLFTLEAFRKATTGAYGRKVLKAQDGLPLSFNPRDLKAFCVEGKFYTIADGYYVNKKGEVWPNSEGE